MMIIAALLTSLTVAREWERGTMEQLISTPVRSAELISGSSSRISSIGIFDLVIAVLMGRFVFDVPLRGNIFLLFILSSLFLTGALALGIYISTVAKNQLMASQMALLVSFLPTFLLSGFTYEIFNMPKFVQAITYFIPARYFINLAGHIPEGGRHRRPVVRDALPVHVYVDRRRRGDKEVQKEDRLMSKAMFDRIALS